MNFFLGIFSIFQVYSSVEQFCNSQLIRSESEDIEDYTVKF